MKHAAAFVVGLTVVCSATVSLAQSVQASALNLQRYQRQLDQIQLNESLLANPAVPADQRLLFDYGGFFSFNYLSVDDPIQDNHGLREYDLVGYVRLNLDDVQEFYAHGRMEYQDFNPGDSFNGRGDEQYHARMERLYYRFDLQKAMAAYQGKQVDYDVAFLGGRQFQYWANGLVLVQTLDGVNVNLEYKTVDLQLLAAVTPADTIDFDSTRPEFDENTHRGFYGAMLSKQIGEHRPFIYFLSQQDYNHDYTKEILGNFQGVEQPIITHFKYNSYYIGVGSSGTVGENFSYGLEGVYEGGSGLSNSFDTQGTNLISVPQTEEEINAWAMDMRFDYLVNDPRHTRFSLEGTAASGDRDRRNSTTTFGGNKSGTDDQAFNGFGQLNNGLAFAPAISNIIILRVGGSTFPLVNQAWFRQMQTGVDLFVYGKTSDRAPIDEASLHKGYLGFEPDFFVNWQLKSDVTLALRYGIFIPGTALPEHDVRQFFYGGLTFAF